MATSTTPLLPSSRPLPPSLLLPLIEKSGSPPILKLGYDAARYGSDHNILWFRHDNWLIGVDRWSGLDLVQNALRIAHHIFSWEDEGWVCQWVCCDVIGTGAGVCDTLWHRGERLQELVKPINAGMKSKEPERFRNVRSELAWNLRRWFRGHLIRFLTRDDYLTKQAIAGGHLSAERCIPIGTGSIMERFVRQASTLRYMADERQGGKLYIESKDDYKDRMEREGSGGGGNSPDEFDALCLTFNDKLSGLEKSPPMRAEVGLDLLMR